MPRTHDYWNPETQLTESRPCTQEELAELASREGERSPSRQELLSALQSLDLKSIRALREGDSSRIALLNAEAEALRAKLAAT